MSSNTARRGGFYRTTKAKMMRAFDKLPTEVRRALADAAFNYVPQPLLTRWARDGWKPETLIWLIDYLDQRELARERKRRERA
jgi:Family of unknown function (DUF6525)